jgi:peptidoglycan hydrolase-like protein with peptidoglycan-binding domain
MEEAPVTVAGVPMRRRVLTGAALIVALGALAVAIANPFAGHAAPGRAGFDNGSPTAIRRVERTSLASQTQVNGTLGFAGSWTVSIPAGNTPSALSQAEQAVTAARSQLATAEAALAADKTNLTRARRTLKADKSAKKTACHGSTSTAAGCTMAKQTVSQDGTSVLMAEQKLAGDRPQLASARAGLAEAEQALTVAEASATSYGDGSSYTMLPTPGRIVQRGQPLYATNGEPTLLLYGSTPAWRAFRNGMSPGEDVAELNANLRALGYGPPSGDSFTAATSTAISALQQAHGLTRTGALDLGAVVFEPGALRVKAVMPTTGQAVQPGPLLTASSLRHAVSIQLDAAQQSEIRVRDRVSVTLPDNSTTPGVVTSVGKVATAPSSNQASGGSSSPTIDVEVRLLDPSAAGHLDAAPVEVSITEQSVHHVLAVPVNALVALAGGGYAVEEVEANGTHRLVAVTPGLFDDAQGLVQVSGNGLTAGQRVVVPAS